MKFTTEIAISPSVHQIKVNDNMMLVGSCFAQEMGHWFLQHRFDVQVNLHGILFHPMVIARCLRRAIQRSYYETSEFVLHNNLHHSWDFHGSFSSVSDYDLTAKANDALDRTYASIERASTLTITWGSAWGYKWNENGQWVSNCHKIPQSNFTKELISAQEIVAEYTLLFKEILAINPRLQIVISVSPVRYWRDGAHGNQVSKANMILAASQLTNSTDFVHYFPAYEIMMDELRDYRFYKADMLHPSPQAVEYIIGKFRDMFFSAEARDYVSQVEPLWRFLAHRPLHIRDDEWLVACAEKEQELIRIRQSYQ